MNHWLLKSEPVKYSWEQMQKDKKTFWDGVRNYQARNFMMNDMKVGDTVLITMARRLVGAVRASDTVARLGGDEFVLIIESIENPQVVEG